MTAPAVSSAFVLYSHSGQEKFHVYINAVVSMPSLRPTPLLELLSCRFVIAPCRAETVIMTRYASGHLVCRIALVELLLFHRA